eukprot:TRINITY_DN2819_c0_g1_i4.p1 TRINITY_DN2819_c0_g1~~TRINITY_DN2819_c0_g1_i4.p1  ORF type:complete len:850 (+),score=203.47 TRINITY_DN2819_c0_g1_i4:351-2900(+)
MLWATAHLPTADMQQLRPHQRINHFPRSSEMTRKDRLAANMRRMQSMHGQKHFDFVPEQYTLPADLHRFHASAARDRNMLWIVKPCASSQGRGIYLAAHPSEVPHDRTCLVSRYLSNPLLIDGFKFDLRIYVAVTSVDPLRMYVYREGLARFGTERYNKDLRNIDNLFMHLTNYSINKMSENFVANEDPEVDNYGNKWSLSALWAYLRDMGIDTSLLWQRIIDVIIKTFISVENHIHSATKMFVPHKNCFELFGFDILVDDNLRPWLLEVNLSPSLACDSPLDLKIKGHLIADLFNLVGMPLQRKQPKKYQRKPLRRPDSLAEMQKRCVIDAQQEYGRRGGFDRVYPDVDSYKYDVFFEAPRLAAQLLQKALFPSPYNSRVASKLLKEVSTQSSQRMTIYNVPVHESDAASAILSQAHLAAQMASASTITTSGDLPDSNAHQETTTAATRTTTTRLMNVQSGSNVSATYSALRETLPRVPSTPPPAAQSPRTMPFRAAASSRTDIVVPQLFEPSVPPQHRNVSSPRMSSRQSARLPADTNPVSIYSSNSGGGGGSASYRSTNQPLSSASSPSDAKQSVHFYSPLAATPSKQQSQQQRPYGVPSSDNVLFSEQLQRQQQQLQQHASDLQARVAQLTQQVQQQLYQSQMRTTALQSTQPLQPLQLHSQHSQHSQQQQQHQHQQQQHTVLPVVQKAEAAASTTTASRPRTSGGDLQALLSSAKQPMDPVQARTTFVAYLERVKHRLVQGIEQGLFSKNPFLRSKHDEQARLDLVEQFVAKVERRNNMSPAASASVASPRGGGSSQLSPHVRAVSLIASLQRFIDIYRLETARLSTGTESTTLPALDLVTSFG